jgi:hypothetical protein
MQGVFFIVLCLITFGEFVVNALGLPTFLRFLPEGMSALLLLYVVFAGTRDRFRRVAPKYWLAFGAMTVVMLCGIVNSPSGAAPMLSGARFFLRAVPLFFLPAVMSQNEAQIGRQLKWLAGLALLQVPLSIYQRWQVMEAGRYSGDDVRGTLLDSGILSMFEICAVLMLTGLFLKGRIGKLTYAALFLLFLLPTAIDETKVTVLLLPMGLLVTLIMGSAPQKRLRYVFMGVVALAIFGALFVPIYNRMEEFNPYSKERDIKNYFTDQKTLNRYMSSNVTGIGTKLNVRRGDAILIPVRFIARDPVTLAFGLGLGSISPAGMGKNFEGPYFALFQKFVITSFTYFILQVGVFGIIIIASLFWMVFRDSVTAAHADDSLIAAIAAGWTGVVALFCVGMLYNIYHEFPSVTYLYAYFSGLVAARCVSLKQGEG